MALKTHILPINGVFAIHSINGEKKHGREHEISWPAHPEHTVGKETEHLGRLTKNCDYNVEKTAKSPYF